MSTTNFINKFQNALNSNKHLLRKESIEFLNRALGTYFEVALVIVGYDSSLDAINESFVISSIDNTLSNPENFTFLNSSNHNGTFEHNEIKVTLKITVPSNHSSEYVNKRLEFFRQQMYKSEEQFWKKQPIVIFQKLSDFKSFIDVTVPRIAIGRTHGYAVLNYNNEDWKEYFYRLFIHFFPEFKFSQTTSTKSKIRFLKETEKLYLGIEYKFENAAYASHINVPELNIVYCIKGKNVKFTSLGILGNPFFFPPTGYLRNYASGKQMFSLGGEYKFTNQMITNSDESVTLIGPEDFGEMVKKHAFFYFHLLRETSASYLNYIEKCLIESI